MKMFNQMNLIWLDLLLLLLISPPYDVCGIIDRGKIPKQPKCNYIFVTESAVCADSKSMAEIAQEIRPGWKHINVVSSTGSFSLEDTNGTHLKLIEDLNLSHIGTVIVPKSAFVHYMALRRLILANASIQTIDDNWFSSNSSQNKLLEMDLHHNKLSLLRRGHFRHLKQLRILNLMDNKIETIEQNSFQDLDQLTHLSVRFNLLRLLTYFGELSNLLCFDLSKNLIGEIPNNVFRSMRALAKLRLDNNAIAIVHDNAFYGLDSLRELNLSSNSLRKLPANPFPLRRLEILDLSHNDITQIHGNAFHELQQLVVLNLSSNSLTELNVQIFTGLKQLQHLLLNDNHIIIIQANTFVPLTSLLVLDLSSNALRTLAGDMFGGQILPLQQLHIEKNSIEIVQPRSFATVSNVNVLSLAHNQIQQLDENLFESLNSLKVLHLQNNKIEMLAQKLLDDISHVKELQIKHNKLTFLPCTELRLMNLEKITVEGNPWQCACLTEIFTFITKQAHLRRIEYRENGNNPYYLGEKPLCYEPSVDSEPEMACVRDIDLVRQYRVIEIYENADRASVLHR